MSTEVTDAALNLARRELHRDLNLSEIEDALAVAQAQTRRIRREMRRIGDRDDADVEHVHPVPGPVVELRSGEVEFYSAEGMIGFSVDFHVDDEGDDMVFVRDADDEDATICIVKSALGAMLDYLTPERCERLGIPRAGSPPVEARFWEEPR